MFRLGDMLQYRRNREAAAQQASKRRGKDKADTAGDKAWDIAWRRFGRHSKYGAAAGAQRFRLSEQLRGLRKSGRMAALVLTFADHTRSPRAQSARAARSFAARRSLTLLRYRPRLQGTITHGPSCAAGCTPSSLWLASSPSLYTRPRSAARASRRWPAGRS